MTEITGSRWLDRDLLFFQHFVFSSLVLIFPPALMYPDSFLGWGASGRREEGTTTATGLSLPRKNQREGETPKVAEEALSLIHI